MALQVLPRCYLCSEPIDNEEPIFSAPCGHDKCSSAVWHGLCLMTWREKLAVRERTRGR